MLGLKLWVVALIVVVMALVRWRRMGTLGWAATWWGSTYVLFRYGFVVPIPSSVVRIYMAIVTAALFAYVSSDARRLQEFKGPIVRLAVERRLRPLLALVLLGLPAFAAFSVWAAHNVPLQAPSFGRTIHPAPPDRITVNDEEVNLITADNPYRRLEHDDPEAFRQHLESGRRVYFQNCFYCHGDAMAGDGMYAHALNPIPSNFTDAGVLPQLQESFLFWRIAKGGPGLPEEGGPWDSAMPAWENFLTTEEIWDVVLFLYDYTGYRPRARGEEH